MTLKIPITRHTSLALSLALVICAQADQATVQPKASQSTIFADQISTLLAKRLPTAVKTVEQQKQEEQAVEALAKNIKYKPLQITKIESNIDLVAHQIISNQSSKLE
ncbi:hypothetical protein IPH25_03405 [bacterium]|nr:MAG: hypothetical protein IPG37_00395 [bacterium]QQR61508.1 MAG: hypothetical protein IPH25_03405 [bacterium]